MIMPAYFNNPSCSCFNLFTFCLLSAILAKRKVPNHFISIYKMKLLYSKPKLYSKLLCFPESIPKEKASVSSCKSFKLMLNKGLIKHVSPGVFTLMPFGMRAFEKLCSLIDSLMYQADGQKVLFPSLVPKHLMVTSDRWNKIDCLFKLKDKTDHEFCLGATHEEVATYLLSKYNISYKSLPVRLYQISSKFRDEVNPKLGLLRGREFIMKDMYAFDSSEQYSSETYNKICELYEKLFNVYLGIKPIKVQASTGEIGGKKSHEYHFKSEIGEDQILACPNCRKGINIELVGDENNLSCEDCNHPLEKCNAIEVGHAFILGTTYSVPFQAEYTKLTKIETENKKDNLFASCYGLGVSRILAASLENLSTDCALRWPTSIAPYLVSVIPPKRNSKEESVRSFSESFANTLNDIEEYNGNVIIDDRIDMTIGKRVQECSEMGIPFLIVVGKHTLENVPKLEIIDVYKEQTYFLSHKETLEMFKNKFNV